jgi:DNA-binding LacI/PurR family transcriptional regulator
MPTIRDVAREAGVGVGTVSRVLSGHPRVAPATRARVEAAVARLGYRPSSAARALARGQSHTLEVVVPLITRHGYVELLRGIEDGLAESDYALVIRTIERPAARERAFTDLGHTSRADGIIFVSLTPPEEVVQRLRQARMPVVLVDREHPDLPGVAVDHEAAAALATRHLIELGHRRIALVDHPAEGLTPGVPEDRRRGFQAAMAEAGLAVRPENLLVMDLSPEGGMAAVETMLALPEPPTAVLVGSDTQAVGVLEATRRRGLRVPRDLAVVGYGDIEMSHHIGLTTVRVPVRDLGRQGVAMLLSEITAPSSPPTRTWLSAELIVRRTTAAPGDGSRGGWLTLP